MSLLGWFSWGAYLLVVVLGGLFRSRFYAIYRAVTLGLHTLIALPLLSVWLADLPVLGRFAVALHALVYVDALFLVRPALRPVWYRTLISLPSLYFAASTFMAFPWAIVTALGFPPWGVWLPYALGVLGMFQSLTARSESRALTVGQVPHLSRLGRVSQPVATSAQLQRPLRVIQITDPHLGPFMPVARLRRICERAVEQQPDLVLLTGDFLTMESQSDERHLADALAPLRNLPGRCFACFGNHDHEAPHVVRHALKSAGVELLMDQATLIETPAGQVQIVGFDFHFKDRAERMRDVCERYPRQAGALRLMLLHDPGAFKHLPEGEGDLVLSGHTHGGQVGLVSLGLFWTVAGWVAKIPDHGLWGRGTDRLYVHRGTGHYGFPLRLGVPAEESVLLIHLLG
jgi:predicted MPP superfamily phosphohydrolase